MHYPAAVFWADAYEATRPRYLGAKVWLLQRSADIGKVGIAVIPDYGRFIAQDVSRFHA
jgi:hypothetical protein